MFQIPIAIAISSIALTGLFIYSSFFVMYVTKMILLPVLVAFILNLLFTPLRRGLQKFGIPAPLAAGGILLVVFTVFWVGVVQLSYPASLWIERAPEAIQHMEQKYQKIKYSILEMRMASEALEKAKSLTNNGTAPEFEFNTNRIVGWVNNLGGWMLGWTADISFGIFATAIFLYFFLASGDLFLEKLVKVMPGFSEKRQAVEIVRTIEGDISGYLLTITAINIGLGIVIGLAMYLWDMPNPMLWGTMAGILNFIPYVGNLFGVGVVTLAAAVTFDQVSVVAMIGGTYLLVTAIEGNFVVPYVLGHKMSLNPVVILLSVFFWGWLWGALGAWLAVPILASVKIVCDHVESLNSVGEFLGQ